MASEKEFFAKQVGTAVAILGTLTLMIEGDPTKPLIPQMKAYLNQLRNENRQLRAENERLKIQVKGLGGFWG